MLQDIYDPTEFYVSWFRKPSLVLKSLLRSVFRPNGLVLCQPVGPEFILQTRFFDCR